jgi:D-threo-aldose 1-dehydrogenase
LAEVANEFGIPLPAAALQFPLAHKIVTSIIPGPRSKNELQEILTWQSLDVPIDFWTALKSKALIHEDAPIP